MIKLSDQLREVWRIAADKNAVAHNDFIEPEDFLCVALACARETAAIELLAATCDLRQLTPKSSHGTGRATPRKGADLHRSERLKRAFVRAEQNARDDECAQVGLAHVLSALMADRTCQLLPDVDRIALADALAEIEKMGQTEQRWHVRAGRLLVSGPCTFSYAEVHCGMFPLQQYDFRPAPRLPATMELRLSAPGPGAATWKLQLPPLRETAEPFLAPNDAEVLATLHGSGPGHLHLNLSSAGDNGSAHATAEVLGRWDWPLHRRTRKTLAAYVNPHHPIVESLAAEVAPVARTQGRSAADVNKVLLALYYALGRRNICWMPPAVFKSHQTLRSPNQMFRESLGQAMGSCLDLSLMTAGCLEKLGYCPVIVLIGEDENQPAHAFSGCWAGATPGGMPVCREQFRIKAWVDREDLGVCEWTPPGNRAGSTETSPLRRALEALGQMRWACLIDISAIRRNNPGIVPIDDPIEPPLTKDVTYAYALAKEFARRRQSANIEAIDLLYGALAGQGPLVTEICSLQNTSPMDLCKRIEATAKPRKASASMSPLITGNTFEIESMTRKLAGDVPVAEEHLLQALAQKALGEHGKPSKSLKLWAELPVTATSTINFLHSRGLTHLGPPTSQGNTSAGSKAGRTN